MDVSVPMEARAPAAGGAPRVGTVPQRPARPDAGDPFRLGFRERPTTTPDGREVWEQVPLTAEDLLYPQEGDHVSQGLPHFSFLHPQADAMRRYLQKRPGIVVTSDVTLVLRHDGKNCAPDVAVIAGHFDTSGIKSGIDLRAVGGRLCFALEAVSTSATEIEDKDLKKNTSRYAREGVEEYFTVYPQAGRQVTNLVGRRLAASGKYVEIAPDAQGRVYSQRLDVYFSIDPATHELVAVDATSGERFRLSDEEEAGRVEAERRLGEEAAARQKEAAARQKAEQRAEQEAAARQKAEQRAEQEAAEKHKEAAARQKAEAEKQKAEQRVEQEAAEKHKEAAARQKAEQRAEQEAAEKHKEAAARQKAEADLERESQARLQALAEVERLKAQLGWIREEGDG